MPHSSFDEESFVGPSNFHKTSTKPGNRQLCAANMRVQVNDLAVVSSQDHLNLIHARLIEHGALIVDLGFDDPDSQYLQFLVDGLCEHHKHSPAMAHSSTRGAMWDVKPSRNSTQRPETVLARSETMQDFPWHTDCSFDEAPPRFFALHVLQHDRHGGGTLSALPVDSLLAYLSKSAIAALHAAEFELIVPTEFSKGVESVIGSVLVSDGTTTRMRYRHDTTRGTTLNARAALIALEHALKVQGKIGGGSRVELAAHMIPKGSVVIMDNGRYLHARNQVKDHERHLRRIRWDSQLFKSSAKPSV